MGARTGSRGRSRKAFLRPPSSMPPSPNSPPLLRRPVLRVVLLALAVRLVLVGWSFATHPQVLHPRPSPPAPAQPGEERNVVAMPGEPANRQPLLAAFGFEASNVAAALVCGDRGLADPFGVPSGPTGWVSPGVVALYAVPFAIAGCFSTGSVLLVFLVALGLSVGIVVLSATTAERLWGDRRITLLAALLAAASPFDLRLFAAASTLDLNLHAFLLLGLVYLLLDLERGATLGRLAKVVVAAAVATLCNPVFVAVAAGGLPLALWRTAGEGARRSGRTGRRQPSRGPVPAGLFPRLALALGLLLAAQVVLVGPYLVVQRSRLGAWTFVKSNAPFEIALGNRPGGDAVLEREDFDQGHPSRNPVELARYVAQGEIAYVQAHGARFLKRLNPGEMTLATLHRTGEYFLGLSHFRALASTSTPLPPRSPKVAAPRDPGAARELPAPPPPPSRPVPDLLRALSHGLVGTAFLAFPLALPGRRRPFRLRPGEWLLYAAALLYAAPHLVASVMPRYVLPVTPLALLLGAAVAVTWLSGLLPSEPTAHPSRPAALHETPRRR